MKEIIIVEPVTGSSTNVFERMRQHYFPRYRVVSVKPNQRGFLYVNQHFQQKLEPGNYRIYDTSKQTQLFSIPTNSDKMVNKTFETLTKDNIQVKVSTVCEIRISNEEKYMEHYNFLIKEDTELGVQDIHEDATPTALMKSNLSYDINVHTRRYISGLNADEIQETLEDYETFEQDLLQSFAANYGLSILSCRIRSVTYPRFLQSMVAKKMESKLLTEIELEKARTSVATALALKNAADILSSNDNIRFLKTLETIEKVSKTGRHNFAFNDLSLSK